MTGERFQFDEWGHTTDHTLLHLEALRTARERHALRIAAKTLLVGVALFVGLLLLATTAGCTASQSHNPPGGGLCRLANLGETCHEAPYPVFSNRLGSVAFSRM